MSADPVVGEWPGARCGTGAEAFAPTPATRSIRRPEEPAANGTYSRLLTPDS